MSAILIASLALVMVATAFLSGIFGMAGGLVLIGVLLALLPVPEAMALHAVTQMASNGWRGLLWWRHIRPRAAVGYLLGSALAIKPLLRITGGRIAPLEKVRTTSRALTRLEELAVDLAGDREVDVAVQHVAASSRAASLAARLRERIPRLGELYLGEAGPVVGAHVGPGMLGVVVSRRDF